MPVDADDPDFTSFEISPGLVVVGSQDVPVGTVKLPLRLRLRFLLTGQMEVSITRRGGTRISLHTPLLRNLPLHLLSRLTKEADARPSTSL